VYRSRLGRAEVVNKFLSQANFTKDEIARLKRDNEQLKERINAARVRLAEREPMVKQLQARSDALDVEFREKKAKALVHEKDSNTLDENIKSREAHLGSLIRELERKRAENNNLESQMVTSPDRLVSETNGLEREKQELAEDIKRMNAEMTDFDDQQAKIVQIESLMNSITTPFEQIFEDKERLDQLQKEGAELTDQCATAHSSVQAMNAKVTGKRKILENRDATLKSLDLQGEKRKNELQKEIDRMEQQLASVNREKYGDAECAALDESCDTLRKQIQKEEGEQLHVQQFIKMTYENVYKTAMDRAENAARYVKDLNDQLKKKTNK